MDSHYTGAPSGPGTDTTNSQPQTEPHAGPKKLSVSFVKFSMSSHNSGASGNDGTGRTSGNSETEQNPDDPNAASTNRLVRARQDSVLIRVRPGDTFSPFADIKVEPVERFDARLGTLGMLRHLRRTGTQRSVKKYVRANNWPICHRIRAELWKEFCLTKTYNADKTLYNDKLVELDVDAHLQYMPVFASQPNTVINEYRLDKDSVRVLLRVLYVIEQTRPDLVYIPILYPVCALMLHYMSEEDTFACIMGLLSHHQKFLMQTETAATASKKTMVALTKKHLKNTYQFIRRLVVPADENLPASEVDERIIAVYDTWMSWVFKDLPFDHIVLIMDSFVCEGAKVLYRVALAGLHHWHKYDHKKLSTKKGLPSDMVAGYIAEFFSNMPLTPNKLRKSAFGIRNMKAAAIHEISSTTTFLKRQSVSSPADGFSASSNNIKGLLTPSQFADIQVDSVVLSQIQVRSLYSWLPPRFELMQPRKLYSLDTDGTSFNTLWKSIQDWEQTIIVIQSTLDEKFGAFCSVPWSTRNKETHRGRFFGTGESLLFKVNGVAVQAFEWVGSDDNSENLFMAADNTSLVVGGGGGEGLSFRNSLETGSSYPCRTFNNPGLSTETHFSVKHLEIFGFNNPDEDEE